jgi:hypothetical protein
LTTILNIGVPSVGGFSALCFNNREGTPRSSPRPRSTTSGYIPLCDMVPPLRATDRIDFAQPFSGLVILIELFDFGDGLGVDVRHLRHHPRFQAT